MATFHTKVAGVTASNCNGISRQAYIAKFCRPGTSVALKREPDNPHDPNAVAVFVTARALIFFSGPVQIGYLSADLAPEIARYMDQGGLVTSVVSDVTGGSRKKRSLDVNLQITKA